MLGVDFSRLHNHLAVAFIIPIIIYSFLMAAAIPERRRFIKRTSPVLLIYLAGCFSSYLLAGPLLDILRIPGSAYIFASFIFFALVLLCSSIWAFKKRKRL